MRIQSKDSGMPPRPQRARVSRRGRNGVIIIRIDRANFDSSMHQPTRGGSNSRGRATEPASHGALLRALTQIGRVPLALVSLFIGALVSWAVNAYAPKAVETISAPPPVEVSAGFDSSVLSDGWTMALTTLMPTTAVPKDVASCNAFRRWATSQGAADIETSALIMSLRGTRIDPVVVTDIRVVIDKKSDTFSAMQLTCPSAGSQEAQQAMVILDEQNPVFRVRNNGAAGGPWFRENSLTLARGEVETFAVQAYAFKAAYTWHLEAIVRIGGRQESVPIAGTYSTTAKTSSYGATWEWDWSQNPQKLVVHPPETA